MKLFHTFRHFTISCYKHNFVNSRRTITMLAVDYVLLACIMLHYSTLYCDLFYPCVIQNRLSQLPFHSFYRSFHFMTILRMLFSQVDRGFHHIFQSLFHLSPASGFKTTIRIYPKIFFRNELYSLFN